MAKPDFSDARQKLVRAREHIADIETRIIAFLATDFYHLRFEKDQGKGRIKVIFDSLHQPDKRLKSVIGDGISNLRSTLDYAAVALIAPITGKPESVGFPFADDVKGFSGEVGKGLAACDQTIRDHFINEVQAYNGGAGHSLWILNKLRNIDKHRFLITTVEVAGLTASWRIGGTTFTDCGMTVMAGESGTFIEADRNIEFTDQPRPTFEVRINELPIVPHTPVPGFLNSIANNVERFLNALEVVV